ncbi:hypothetical protein L0F63_004102 [Massospora cicadina]|nr:hypothetical protein L0F63_004102 [Massospora cicadina]
MTKIKVIIDLEQNLILVYNNGSGIPVEIHKEEKVYIPKLIFGHLFTSSNYDDSEKKVVGGHNGYWAKMCNIFSTEITFQPDLSKFQMNHLNADIGVTVFLNDSKLKLNNFKDYIHMYLKSTSGPNGEDFTKWLVFERVSKRWEVSFVNSISTSKGGTHVNYVVDVIKKLKRDSAKALAMAGLTKVGWGYYSMFPLYGKLLNVQDASSAIVKGKKELINIFKIMGLNSKVDNLDTSKLWFEYLMIMMDQDHDGDFEYFSNLIHHMIRFEPMQYDERQLIDLTFNKKKVCSRKE